MTIRQGSGWPGLSGELQYLTYKALNHRIVTLATIATQKQYVRHYRTASVETDGIAQPRTTMATLLTGSPIQMQLLREYGIAYDTREEVMKMPNLSVWIEHLSDPLVLAGFVIMLFTRVLIALVNKNVIHLSKQGAERTLKRAISSVFILGLMVLCLGFVYALSKPGSSHVSRQVKPEQGNHGQPSPRITTGVSSETHSIRQKSTGAQSPNIISGEGGSVQLNYSNSHQDKEHQIPGATDNTDRQRK